MKKIFITLATIFSFILTAQAETIQAISLEGFSTESPKKSYSVQTIENVTFKDGHTIQQGTIINGNIIKVKHASRGKRNAYFEFVPTSYRFENEVTGIRNPSYKARVIDYAPLDPKSATLMLGKSAVGFFIPGATQGISFIQGVADAEDGDRLKSGFVQVYKDSPLSYVETGSEIKINPGDKVFIKTSAIKPKRKFFNKN